MLIPAQIRKNRFPAKSPVIGVKLTGSTTHSNRHAWRSALVRCGAVRTITAHRQPTLRAE